MSILKYLVDSNEVWQQEKFGRRLLARCATKAAARRIAKLLNAELEQKRKELP